MSVPSPTGGRVVLAGVITFAAAWTVLAAYRWIDGYHPIPSTVPPDAIEIPLIAKSRGWIACSREDSLTRCRVFNQSGRTITDDVFLPFDGGPSIEAGDLKIEALESGPDYVRLKNGRLLLPRTNFVEHKEFAQRVLEPPTYRRSSPVSSPIPPAP